MTDTTGQGRRSAIARNSPPAFDPHDSPKPGACWRGVWIAPWVGANGEMVLFAVTDRKRLLCDPVTVPLGVAARTIADELWQRLAAASSPPLQSAVHD
jgi:hypothetical protein